MEIVHNINKLYNTYGKYKIKSDFHLIVAYWKVIGEVEISSKDTLSLVAY